jgi:hypothetical protein
MLIVPLKIISTTYPQVNVEQKDTPARKKTIFSPYFPVRSKEENIINHCYTMIYDYANQNAAILVCGTKNHRKTIKNTL